MEQENNEKKANKRTLAQNRSIRLFDKLLCDALNLAGLEAKLVLKPTYKIWWTPESIHRDIWLTTQKAMFSTESSTELEKLGQIEKIHETIMRMLGEKFNLPYIPFPSVESSNEELNQDK